MTDNGPETRTAFAEQLWELRDTVLRLGTFVEGMLDQAMKSLLEQDGALALQVRRSDDVADALDLETEQVAQRLLALQQPLARDLRAITASLRIATDLERIGDYSKDIAKVAAELAGEPYVKPLEDIPQMGGLVGEMVRQAMRAFVDADLDAARRVAEMDREVDRMWKQVWADLMGVMQSEPRTVGQSAHLLLVARYLERMGDHAVNIAERVNYIATGQIGHLA